MQLPASPRALAAGSESVGEAATNRRADDAQLLGAAEVGEHEHADDAHSLEDS